MAEMDNNVANGLAWSYYCGYLKLILPGMADRIKASEWANKGGKMSSKVIILIPESCYAPGSLTDIDSNVKHAGHLELKINRAGNIARSYKNNVYMVKDGDEEYFCVVEYATPLLTLYEMTEIPESGLTPRDRNAQRILFKDKMNDILSKVGMTSSVIIHPFSDKEGDAFTPLAPMLVKLIKDN